MATEQDVAGIDPHPDSAFARHPSHRRRIEAGKPAQTSPGWTLGKTGSPT